MDSLSLQKTRAQRIHKSFTARFRVCRGESYLDASAKWNIATIKNLSSTGTLLNYNEKIPINTELELNIALPFVNESVHCFGRVCRVDEDHQYVVGLRKVPVYGIGVYFKVLDGNVKARIDNFAKNFGSKA
ncbi:MAG: PilZ domain-containing protein [bacterium]